MAECIFSEKDNNVFLQLKSLLFSLDTFLHVVHFAMGPSDLAPKEGTVFTWFALNRAFPKKEGEGGLHVVHSGQGLLFAVPQEHGLISGCLVVVIHSVVHVTAGHQHTAQPPGVSQGSLDGVDELFMVSSFPQF